MIWLSANNYRHRPLQHFMNEIQPRSQLGAEVKIIQIRFPLLLSASNVFDYPSRRSIQILQTLKG